MENISKAKILVTFIFIFLFTNNEIYSDEWDRVQVNRMQWFYRQRSFPNENVPQGAYNNAIKQYMKNAGMNGYFSPGESWHCIGPMPGAMGFPISGRIATLKFNPGDTTGMTIFAGGANGGVWKTTDGGTTWAAKTDFITSLSSGALAIGQNPSGQFVNIYYGTGESHAGFNFCYYGDGLYKSTDNGESWYQINDPNLPDNPTYFSRIVVRPGHPNELLAACGTNHTNISYQSGLFRSTDYGETWLRRIVPDQMLEGRVCSDVVFSRTGNMAYITGPDESSPQIYEKGVMYRISTDGGATFGPPRDDIIKLIGRSHIAVSSYDTSRVYILTHTLTLCDPGSCSQYELRTAVFVSTDAGYSFSKRSDFLAINCGCAGGDAYQSWYDMFIYISPQNHDIIYAGLINLWKSTDGGQSFRAISPPHSDMQNMDFDIHNADHVILGSDGGFYRSTNGGENRSWYNLNDQLSMTQIYRISTSPFNPEVIVGGSQDNGIQSKFALTDDWRDALGGNDGTSVLCSQLDPNIIFGGFGNYTSGSPPPIVRSTNAGATFSGNFRPQYGIWDSQNDWIPPLASSVLPGPPVTEYFYTARRCFVSPPNEQVMIRFFYTSNNGSSWNKLGNGIIANESPQNLSVSKSNPQVMFLSTGSYAWPQTNQKLYKSIDGGMNWTEILNSSSTEVPNRYITHIEIDPSDENIVFLTLSGFNSSNPGLPGHVFCSINGGTNWTNISGSMADIPVNDFVILYNGAKNYLIGTDAGVLVSCDGGYKWLEIGQSLPHAVVTDIEYNPITGLVRAATFGRGVWEFSLVSTAANINYTLYLNSDANGLNVQKDIVVEQGGKLVIPFACTIKMKEGKKIIIKDGGEIDVTSGGKVNFTSISGKWGGIEIQGRANIKNCDFTNTETPIIITGQNHKNEPVSISNCTFNNGSVIVVGRNNVSIADCRFNGGSGITGTALSAVYSDDINITNNTINNVKYSGISVSNSYTIVTGNKISCDNGNSPPAGISFDNCSNSKAFNNQISNFKNDIYLFNSTPDIQNNIEKSNILSKNKKPDYNYEIKINRLLSDADNAKQKNELLTAELNIIELLMLTENNYLFREKYKYLVPSSLPDGIKMINEKLFGKIDDENINNTPETFSLAQNYPNPFNPVTHFEFNIAKFGFVSLKIYDILGEEMKTVVNESLKPGTYDYEFDGSNYSSGVYFYKLFVIDNNGGIIFTETKKMLLVK